MEFAPSSPAQIDAIAALLQHAFHVASDDPLLDRSYLHWKYFAETPSWPGSRSYVLTSGSEIVAHGSIWPLQLRTAEGLRPGISFGDWVAKEDHPGAGLLLLRRLMALSSFVLVTGGAPVTRAILPRVGFQPWAQRRRFTRVLRPLRQASSRPDTRGWREPARILRNSLWSLRPLSPVRDWIAEPSAPTPELLSALPSLPGTLFTVDDLLYRLRCPAVRFQLLALRERGEPRGYCLLSFAGGQARIADLRVAAAGQADWNAAVSAVVRAARADTTAAEITTFGSTPLLDDALTANGFLPRGLFPLVVYDREDPAGDRFLAQPVPHLGMIEDDAASLRTRDVMYTT